MTLPVPASQLLVPLVLSRSLSAADTHWLRSEEGEKGEGRRGKEEGGRGKGEGEGKEGKGPWLFVSRSGCCDAQPL